MTVDWNVDLSPAVNSHRIGLDLMGVLCAGHVLDKNGSTVNNFHRKVVNFFNVLYHGIGIYHVVVSAYLCVAGRNKYIIGLDGTNHIHGG